MTSEEKGKDRMACSTLSAPSTSPPSPSTHAHLSPLLTINMLRKAVSRGDVKEVRALLTRGSSDFCDPEHSLTLLHWAVGHDHVDVAELLLKSGATIGVPDSDGFLVIHRAAWQGNLDLTRLLLRNGAAVDAAGGAKQRSPLILASMRGHSDIVALLVEEGHADIDFRDKEGLSAVEHAALLGKDVVVKYLMERGADCTKARILCESGADKARTVPERDSYNRITKMLCAVWVPQSFVTVA